MAPRLRATSIEVGARHVSPAMVAVLLALGSSESSWSEETIGSAQIVIHQVRGNLPTGGEVPITEGVSVVRDESVRTESDSSAKFLLRDKTNLAVGPNSTIRLDRFVYAGAAKNGEIALNMAKGTFRFITGDADKHAYEITTPTAAIGIRGTVLLVKATSTKTDVILEEGKAIVCRRARAQERTVDELERMGRCKRLLFPGQQATVTQTQTALSNVSNLAQVTTQFGLNQVVAGGPSGLAGAGVGGLGAGVTAPVVAAGIIGAAVIGSSVAAEATSAKSQASPQPLSP
jgi:hypothetical protein